MAGELETLLVRIAAEQDQLRQELLKAEGNVRKSTDNMSRSMDRFRDNAIAAAKRIAAPLAAAFSVRAVQRFAMESIRALDEIAQRARTAGISGETLQELRFAFGELAGTELRDVDMSLQRFNRRLGLAVAGGGAAKDTFRQLGIELRTASGATRSTEVVLEEALTKLAGVTSESERAAMASKLFGEEAGPRLAAALGQGIEALQKTREETKGLIGEQSLRDAELLNNAFGRLAKTIKSELSEAIVSATARLADMFGFIDRGELGRLRNELENVEAAIRDIEAMPMRSMIFGDLDQLRARREQLVRQIRIEELRTPFSERPSRGGRPVEETEDDLSDLSPVTTDIRHRMRRMPSFSGEGRMTRRQAEEERELRRQAESLTQRFQTELERAAEQVDLAESLFKRGLISEDTLKRTREQLASLKDDTSPIMASLGESFGSTLLDSAVNAMMGIETRWEDMARRMLLNAAFQQLMSTVASFGGPVGTFASFLGFGKRAAGGPVMQNQPVIVGERRPEIFIPSTAGRIEPRVPSSGGGMSVYVDARHATDPAETERAVERGVRAAVQISGAQTQAMIGQLFRPAMA